MSVFLWVSGGNIPTRLKALQKKRALSRDNKPFCHELKHVLLRLESTAEDQTIAPPPMGASTAAGDLDLDEDWDSDCGDYLDDPRYSNDAALGIGGPQSAARAFERVLGAEEREYGVGHPLTAPTLRRLGNACGAGGDATRQRQLLERAIAAQARTPPNLLSSLLPDANFSLQFFHYVF